ncbi:MAG: DNA primase large subunit PriL, partial [Candidatus Bathyarchaeia archaeon]
NLKTIVDRAFNRIEEALATDPPQVSYRPGDEDKEIPSFPVAIILASATNNDYIKRRYALAEAIRAYNLLQFEDEKLIIEIVKVFNWNLRIHKQPVGYRRYDFAIFFTDFLRNAEVFHEDEWKLVNRVMMKGEVFLNKREVARLVQEEVRRRIEKRFSMDVRQILPEAILQRVENLNKRYADRIGQARYTAFPKEVVNEAFPPCIQTFYGSAKTGTHISHLGRFTLTSFLININMKVEDIVNLFRASSDFNERMTRYQVEHISGSRGSRTKYRSPTCETLKTHALCPGPDDLCKTIRSPLRYYAKKTRMLKK